MRRRAEAIIPMGMFEIGFVGALLGGLLSFASPCVLPLVPPYLCYVAGLSAEELLESGGSARARAHVVRSALAFVLGFATVFVALGATASAFGEIFRRAWGTEVALFGSPISAAALLAGATIAAMGLHFLGAFRLPFLHREARLQVTRKPPGLIGGYALGLAFAFGWTPCIGPILAAILAVAGSQETAFSGALLLFIYSMGLGLPFLAAAAFAPAFLARAGGFRRRLPQVERAMGGFLVVTGVLFVTGQMSALSYWLLETFPALAAIG